MRSIALSTANAGMTRLRHKGNAAPATLYDCLNAYITLSGTVKPRPGTVIDTTLPAGTKGLVAHEGKMHVFSAAPVTMIDPDYVNVILRHPRDATAVLQQVHFAAPFMGFLYVVASYDDESLYHFWVEALTTWAADTDYKVGERVYPSTPNGFAYRATRTDQPNPLWAAGVARSVSDVIEPTVNNGFKYTVIAVSGDNPASGDVEPIWPEAAGETIIEQSYGAGGTQPPPDVGDGDPPEDDIDDRYENPHFDFPALISKP